MAKSDTSDIKKFLKSFPPAIGKMVMWLREFVWDEYPTANELIYDNYNALAVGWSPTEKVGHTFCSIAVGRSSHNLHFGFYQGSEISDPEKRLIGEGNQYRYLLVTSQPEFPKTYIKKLLKEAHANSLVKVKDKKLLTAGKTILKSISAKKRPAKKTMPAKKSPAKKVAKNKR